MAEDIDKLIAWAKANGWTVENSADGYRHFYAPAATSATTRPHPAGRADASSD